MGERDQHRPAEKSSVDDPRVKDADRYLTLEQDAVPGENRPSVDAPGTEPQPGGPRSASTQSGPHRVPSSR